MTRRYKIFVSNKGAFQINADRIRPTDNGVEFIKGDGLGSRLVGFVPTVELVFVQEMEEDQPGKIEKEMEALRATAMQ
jgi:hypothetical protein